MQLHQARYFVALAKFLNFTRAAEACGVTQPALTRAVKQLEHELGGELLRRERGLSRLTELGERMLPPLTRCVEAAEAARSVARDLRAHGPATLRIALGPGVDAALVAGALSALARDRPRLRLRLVRGAAAEVAEALRRGAVEIAVCPAAGMDWPRFESWPLTVEPLRALMAAGHPLAGRPALALADLKDFGLIRRGFCDTDPAVAAALERSGVAFGAMLETAGEADAIALLAAGAGVAIGPWSEGLRPGLAAIPVSDLDLSRAIRIHAVAGRRRSLMARALLAGLRAAAVADGDLARAPVGSAGRGATGGVGTRAA